MKQILRVLSLVIILACNSWALEVTTVTVDVLAKSTSSWNGKALPGYTQGQPEVTILRIVVPPGVELPLHEHPVINAGVMLKGELTVITQSNETLHFKEGEAIVEVVDTWHYGRNEGVVPAEIIVFYAGIEGMLVTVKEK